MFLTHIKSSYRSLFFTEASKKNKSHTQVTPPPSMHSKNRFASEANLVNFFEALLNNRKKPSKTGYLKEFDCSNGIADIIMFELRKGGQSNASIGNVPSRWAFALHQLPYRKAFLASDFAEAAGVTERRALTALRQYANLGFCKEKKGKGLWVKTKQPIPIVNKIYAIEAKLHDWKRALSQAYRYLDYANQSWVILDNGRVNPALENIHEFQRLNVGLASLKAGGKIIIHFNPTQTPPKSPQKFWQANSEIASRFMTLSV